jgi:hypothetical protein
MKDQPTSYFTLFASASTLICCGLPSLFVVVGAGASFATLVSTFPLLVEISRYKTYIFLGAFVMLCITGYVNYRASKLPCPINVGVGKQCIQTRESSRYIYYFSVSLFLFSSTVTYILPRFF